MVLGLLGMGFVDCGWRVEGWFWLMGLGRALTGWIRGVEAGVVDDADDADCATALKRVSQSDNGRYGTVGDMGDKNRW